MLEISERTTLINCTTCTHYKVCRLTEQAQQFEIKDVPHFIQVHANCIHYKPAPLEPIKIN